MASNTNMLTTNAGAPVVDDNNSLTVGARGPVLLEDFQLIDKMQQFDRERIPERVVHARGMSAKGTFEVTHDISHLTCADMFKKVGEKTPVFVRFSTVIHERGSPETLRDPRGFAVKFYTNEGNWDLVGNNIPVFFIRDGIKFPDMVRALKPNPKNHIQEGWRITDFFSHHPESMNMFTWVFDDHGIPLNYRHMEGFGVHTFKLLSAEGKETLVKFHWKPKCGLKFLLDEEAQGIADHSHATRDLFDSIESGDYPEWELLIQTMDPADENKFEFDPLDVTKVWPEERFPLKPVGRMVLDRNVDNFFNESEQVAFSPAVIVPGITYTDDKLLQSRLFSYADTQRYRLGANYLMLPVNAPKRVHGTNHQDGKMNFGERSEEVNYYPSRHTDAKPAAPKPEMPTDVVSGQPVREVIPKANDFQQPGERFRLFDADRQKRFIGRIAMLAGHPKALPDTRRVWVDYFTQCDPNMGAMLEAKLREEGKEISPAGSVHTSTLEGTAQGQAPSAANGMNGVGMAPNGTTASDMGKQGSLGAKVKNAARGVVNALRPGGNEE